MATKVTIQIGPISAPARILTAVRDKDESELRTVCQGTNDKPHDAAKVNQYFRCTHVDPEGKPCGREERSFHPYPRGKENDDGTWTIPTAEQLAGLEASEDMKNTLSFLPADRTEVEAKAVPFGKFYYVGPAQMPHLYGLARDTILQTRDKYVWLTQWAYRTAPSFVRAVVMDDLLAIQQLALPEQVVARPQLDLPPYDPRYLEIALTSAELLKVEFNPHTFPDVRKSKLAEILGGAATVAGAPAASTPVETGDDALLVSMQQWLDQHGASVGGAGKTAPKQRRATPTKSAAPAAPRKRASRKSATKETA